MKKILYLAIFISHVASCKQTNEKITIGILFDSYSNARFQKEKVYLEEKIAELGGNSIIMSAGGNEAVQEQQAREMLQQGVDILIIISTNVNKAAAMVRLAHANNVKVIAYDRLIKNCDLDYYISFDGNKVGELLAEYAVEKVPEGNYVLMNGDKSDDNAIIFYEGTKKVIQPLIDNGKINIVYDVFIEDWSSLESKFEMNKVLELSSTKIDVVISQYDGLSEGVIEALKEKGLEKKVLVTGQDAEVDACQRIMKGTQNMTIYKPVKKMAYKCIELAFDIIKSGKIKSEQTIHNGRSEVPTYLLDPVLVDKTNIRTTVVDDGFLTIEEIMNKVDK
ncbi:MAG: sugar ABC transporter substrate-binding protein [Chloroflexia bacterium]|nr:sugar ABC transporter substrate-binding protein [Chloroflexia bacterium]